tara:strand:- start:54800 stop:55216 length:417 start_codon:yes stop_codon:yes gene_type:complete
LFKRIFHRFFALAFSISFFLFLLTSSNANAEEDLSAHWNGIWIVEGTLFSIAVAIEKEELKIQALESLGFIWSNKNGKVEGNLATVEVEFAGATSMVQAELVDPNTAVAIATSCLPDFMVACLLSKDREAVFRKVAEN